jgi:hypothetical protein
VGRIVEVRACHPGAASGGRYVLDWGGTQGAVAVTGNLIFHGDIEMRGLGWRGGDGGGGVAAAVVTQARAHGAGWRVAPS